MNDQAMSKERIAEALRLLDEAARNRKDEVRELVTGKYADLKGAMSPADQAGLAGMQRRAVEAAMRARALAAEKARKIAGQVDEQVHQNPWPYIAGTAIVAFVAGYLLGRRHE